MNYVPAKEIKQKSNGQVFSETPFNKNNNNNNNNTVFTLRPPFTQCSGGQSSEYSYVSKFNV